MDAKIATINTDTSSVIDRLHPPIVQVMEAKAANGVLAEGLLVAEDENAKLIKHQKVADAAMTGVIDAANKVYTHDATPAPILPGSVRIDNNNVAPQVVTDDGHGRLIGDCTAGTVNYETGEISVTLTTAPAAGKTVVVDHKTRPVGVLATEIDTASDDAAPVVRHGTVVLEKLLTGAAAPDAEDLAALAGIGIYAV